MIFSGAWKVIKGFLDEKIRRKITVFGTSYYKDLLEWVDEDQIPTFLGGTNQSKFIDDEGPWNEYELVDSIVPGAEVGIKRKNDPSGKIFTPADYLMLENYLIDGAGTLGSKGAVIIASDGTIKPHFTANKTHPIDPEKYVDIV